ncbi:hypothetical protein [Rubrobacter xylanophilus]|uniref:hypothetical protein n=1 Tax=Rubrobacter xylanophilus TaxID=49319 RepID=UPI001C63BBB5|nr:hypothetical protein [Rubrobacter xylanophilus]
MLVYVELGIPARDAARPVVYGQQDLLLHPDVPPLAFVHALEQLHSEPDALL